MVLLPHWRVQLSSTLRADVLVEVCRRDATECAEKARAESEKHRRTSIQKMPSKVRSASAKRRQHAAAAGQTGPEAHRQPEHPAMVRLPPLPTPRVDMAAKAT